MTPQYDAPYLTYPSDQYDALQVLKDAERLLSPLVIEQITQIAPTVWRITTRSA